MTFSNSLFTCNATSFFAETTYFSVTETAFFIYIFALSSICALLFVKGFIVAVNLIGSTFLTSNFEYK